ncbi:MAG: type I-E CRISPR-associated endonuclease Cas1 [Myxococcales bacterium]|nr:type I-E CRISPR-associated endonuclease Cas1 [Myxococcales bacterium]
MLKGRLGLASARIPHRDRHGLMWLERGRLATEDGTVQFTTAGYESMAAGTYAIPHQAVSLIFLGPGTTVSHDAARILARHGTGLAMVGSDGVRLYASFPAPPDQSRRARRQVEVWADPARRLAVARRMYAWRLGEVLPEDDITVLRGIEGARMKATYKLLAQRYGVTWRGRRYDRRDPMGADLSNQAINHASVAVLAAAQLAVVATGTIAQLGFIHEDSGQAFALDIADLFRDTVTLPIAFAAVRKQQSDEGPRVPLERSVRRIAGKVFREQTLVVKMIDRIKELFDHDGDDGDRDASAS